MEMSGSTHSQEMKADVEGENPVRLLADQKSKDSTGEPHMITELILMLREAYDRANIEDEDKDWRTMPAEEWDKFLGTIDKQLEVLRDAVREEIEEAKKAEETPSVMDEAELLTARSRSFTTRGSYTDPETGEVNTTENNYRAFITKIGVAGERTQYISKNEETRRTTWESRWIWLRRCRRRKPLGCKRPVGLHSISVRAKRTSTGRSAPSVSLRKSWISPPKKAALNCFAKHIRFSRSRRGYGTAQN